MSLSGMLGMLTSPLSAVSGIPFLGRADGGTFWLPVRAAEGAKAVDELFYFIFWICLFFFTLLMALMVIFAIRYRRREEGEEVEKTPSHNLPLEIVWTTIPILLVVAIFFFGFQAYLDMSTPPTDAYEIQVTGQKWKWSFTYPNGYMDELLHVPAGRPVTLVMTSEDVIHSMSIRAFRIKNDVVPGRYRKVWFTANRPGAYDLYCAEYCGTQHSGMISTVIVHEAEDFDVWIADHGDILGSVSPAEGGERLYNLLGCKQCHSTDGAPGVGPTFLDLYGTMRKIRDQADCECDEDYVRESVLDPTARISQGFEPVMPTFKGRLKDKEITAIIAYMKTLSVHAPDEPAADEAAGEAAETDTTETDAGDGGE